MVSVANRMTSWAKSGYTARDYVQDGLVAMWDGIENAGWGHHDASATVWKDLIGSNDLDTFVNASFLDDCALINNGKIYKSANYTALTAKTLEVVFNVNGLRGEFAAFESRAGGEYYVYFSTYGLFTQRIVGKGITVESFVNEIGTSRTSCSVIYNGNTSERMYLNGIYREFEEAASYRNSVPYAHTIGGGYDKGNSTIAGNVCCVRMYSSELSAAEIAANYAVDKARFNLPD